VRSVMERFLQIRFSSRWPFEAKDFLLSNEFGLTGS
jgi:hypothetical protein